MHFHGLFLITTSFPSFLIFLNIIIVYFLLIIVIAMVSLDFYIFLLIWAKQIMSLWVNISAYLQYITPGVKKMDQAVPIPVLPKDKGHCFHVQHHNIPK